MKRIPLVLGYLLLSSLAAMMLLMVSWTDLWTGSDLAFEERLMVALAFMGSCSAGIILSLGPRRLHSLRRRARTGDAKESVDRGWVGHHPDCGRFEDHVIAISSRRYCAGCLGLALGSSISLTMMVCYLLVPPVDPLLGRWLVVLGLSMVALCMAEVAWHPSIPCLHVLSNLALVMGFLLVVTGVTSSSADGTFGLLAVLICFLWLDARIQLSDWKHERACGLCGRSCRSY